MEKDVNDMEKVMKIDVGNVKQNMNDIEWIRRRI